MAVNITTRSQNNLLAVSFKIFWRILTSSKYLPIIFCGRLILSKTGSKWCSAIAFTRDLITILQYLMNEILISLAGSINTVHSIFFTISKRFYTYFTQSFQIEEIGKTKRRLYLLFLSQPSCLHCFLNVCLRNQSTFLSGPQRLQIFGRFSCEAFVDLYVLFNCFKTSILHVK